MNYPHTSAPPQGTHLVELIPNSSNLRLTILVRSDDDSAPIIASGSGFNWKDIPLQGVQGVGLQTGLRESTVTERLASGPRIEDGARFTHTLARLLFALETAVVCIKCDKPAYVDWFRDRFRFRHSANRGAKPSIHASASILPILRLTRLDLGNL